MSCKVSLRCQSSAVLCEELSDLAKWCSVDERDAKKTIKVFAEMRVKKIPPVGMECFHCGGDRGEFVPDKMLTMTRGSSKPVWTPPCSECRPNVMNRPSPVDLKKKVREKVG